MDALCLRDRWETYFIRTIYYDFMPLPYGLWLIFWHRHKKNGSLLSGLLFLDRKCQHCTPMFCTVTWGKTSAQWNPIVIVLFGFVFSNIEKKNSEKKDKTIGIRPKWLILTLRMILCGNIEFLILIHSVLGKLKSNNFWTFF